LTDSLISDGQEGGCSLNSSPCSNALESPLGASFLSDSESLPDDERHHHRHKLFRHKSRGMTKVRKSDSSGELSDSCSTSMIDPDGNPIQSKSGVTLYMNSAGASPRSTNDFSPTMSVGGVTILRRGVEPTNNFEKICLVGDSSVGKTTVANVLEFGTPGKSEKRPTYGFNVRVFSCISGVDCSRFDVQVYDIGGNERRNSLLQPFFADAGAVVLCYSVGCRESLFKLSKWLALMRQSLPEKAKEPQLFIIGLKGDTSREVQIEDVSLISVNSGASILGEFSRKQTQAIEEAFCRVASSVYLNTQFRRFKNEVCK